MSGNWFIDRHNGTPFGIAWGFSEEEIMNLRCNGPIGETYRVFNAVTREVRAIVCTSRVTGYRDTDAPFDDEVRCVACHAFYHAEDLEVQTGCVRLGWNERNATCSNCSRLLKEVYV